jgi:hypothetical protein
MVELYLQFPIRLDGMVIKHRDKFTLLTFMFLPRHKVVATDYRD